MNNPIIQADRNLVLNGDFTSSFTDWDKGPINPLWLSVEREQYEGDVIRFLKAGNLSSVSQELAIPKESGVHARYHLSFLCETRHSLPGTMIVSSVGGHFDPLTITLVATGCDPDKDRVRRERGLPLDFKPTPYDIPLDLLFLEQDKIRVEVKSPPNSPDQLTCGVLITRIKILLELEPVALLGWKLDEEASRKDEPLYLCIGASALCRHRLGFELEPGSTWEGTRAALTINDPSGSIAPMPDWGADHPLDETWFLDCPYMSGDGPYLFSMNLSNEFTADAYPIEVSLGHHRLEFKEWQEATYYPVIEYGQSVRLGVLVASFYTAGPVVGQTVNWAVEGTAVTLTTVSDGDGWAYFDYTPDIAGDFNVVASVTSLYYANGIHAQSTELKVLATDPWKDVLAVTEGIEARWEEKTGYPNRGTQYPVTVKLPADSPLLGSEFSLHWSGDTAEQLGVVVSPALEQPVLIDQVDAVWTLTNEDRLDGRFNLSLVCSKLLLPSPKKPMSLARNLVKIGEVREANKFPVVDENESVLLRVQALHVIISGEGDPVSNALVDWQTPEGVVATVTGVGGWASLLYTPTSDGLKVITARVRAHDEAVSIDQPFEVRALATSPWKSEVTILLDGVQVDRVTVGVLCRRGQSHVLKVAPLAGSTLIGKSMALNWRGAAPDIGLMPSDLGIPRLLPTEGLEWTIRSEADTSRSALFELKLASAALQDDRELFGRLVSLDLADELALMLDQVPASLGNQTLYPCLGAQHQFIVTPKALSPLVGLSTQLQWFGTPAEQLGATVEPALNLPQTLNDGGARWRLDFSASQNTGTFALALQLPHLQQDFSANAMVLGHHRVRIEARREASIDPVLGQEPAWLWAQVFSYYTDRGVDQVPVAWRTQQGVVQVQTNADGWAGFAFEPASADAHEVEVSVASPYDQFVHKQIMSVTVLASDPWADLKVCFDDLPAERWGQKTYFPRRNGQHVITISANDDSPLLTQEMTLGLTGTGPDELGLSFLPINALGTPARFEGTTLTYEFEGGDLKDGAFALCLGAQRLARLSPANAMSLGIGEHVLKIFAHDTAYQILDWEQAFEAQVSVVSSITRKPMRGWRVTWVSPDLGEVTSLTNFYGVASVRFTPTTPGEAQVIASVGEGEHSVFVSMPYALNHPRQIHALTSPTPTGQEGKVVEAFVTVVSAKTGEPLQGVEVMWDYPASVLESTYTNEEGIALVKFRLANQRRSVLDATVRGGYGGWDYKNMVFTLELFSSGIT